VQMLDDLVNGRSKFHNVFHYPVPTWGDVALIGWLVDGAALVTQHALLEASYAPYARALRRICAEESLHLKHGEALTLELSSGTPAQREMFQGALERWWGWLPATSSSLFSGFHAGLLLLELLIVAGAVVELRGYRFPLLVLPACVAAWLFVTDLVSNGGDWSAIVTIVVGLGYLLAGMALVMVYFNLSEYVTEGYKLEAGVPFHFQDLMTGYLAPFFWFYIVGGLIVPVLIMVIPATRSVRGVITAAALVVVSMWLERYLIVVGGFRVPLMPYTARPYAPTLTEWSIFAGAVALFALIISVFVKVFPMVSVWEVVEHRGPEPEPEVEDARRRAPVPEPAPAMARSDS